MKTSSLACAILCSLLAAGCSRPAAPPPPDVAMPADEVKALTESLIGDDDPLSGAGCDMASPSDPLFDRGGFRYKTARALKGNEHAFGLLLKALKHDDPMVRGVGAKALGRQEDQRAEIPLVDCYAAEKDLWVRQMCLQSLGELGGPIALDTLAAATDDPSVYIRAEAMQDIRMMNTIESMLVLEALARKYHREYPPHTIVLQNRSAIMTRSVESRLKFLKVWATDGDPEQKRAAEATLRLWETLHTKQED